MRLDAQEITTDPSLRHILEISRELQVKVYLVGGGVRDILLGRGIKDLDFALTDMPEEFPRTFAERLGGTFFWLDRERRQSRVVTRLEGGPDVFDFAPMRGGDIDSDLLLRDFTINAMALELSDRPRFIDPLNGEADLRKRLIRTCAETSLEDDPLRLLRAIRFAAILGFAIEDGTFADIGKKAPLLEKVAAERTRDEFLRTLGAPGVAASLQMLHDGGLLAVLMPLARRDQLAEPAVAGGILGAVRAEGVVQELARYFPDHAQRLADHLDREVEGGVIAFSLLKLAAFTGGAEGLGTSDDWSARLRLGRRAARMLAILAGDPAPVFAALSARPTRRAMFRFFRDLEPAGLELLMLAHARKELPRWLCSDLIRYRFQDYDPAERELLLSGDEIMQLLGIEPGGAVGAAMERLREAESRGLVGSSEEAREFLLKNLLTKQEPMR